MINIIQKFFLYTLIVIRSLLSVMAYGWRSKGKKKKFTLYQDLFKINANLQDFFSQHNIDNFVVDKTDYQKIYATCSINANIQRSIITRIKKQFSKHSLYYQQTCLGLKLNLPFYIPYLPCQSVQITEKIIINNRRLHNRFAYVELQFWVKKNNTFSYPNSNATFNEISADYIIDGQLSSLNTISTPLIETHINRVNFEIDAVYTWVNANDSEWLEDKKKYALEAENKHVASTGESRFDDHNELKNSIASIKMYAPFIRHIYIVTSSGKPEWLDDNDDFISMVYHKNIFNNIANLPTFNSHAIESNLHRIENLSTHFLYFNDDVFLNDFCTAEDFFFSNGYCKHFYSNKSIGILKTSESIEAPTNAALNNRSLITESYNRTLFKGFAKTPHPLNRETLIELNELFEYAFSISESNKIRDSADYSITSSLFQNYSYLNKSAAPSSINNINIGLDNKFYFIKIAFLLLAPSSRRRKTFCLNEANNKNDKTILSIYLQYLYYQLFNSM